MSMDINPSLKKGDRIILIVMSDPYSPISVGTKGTVIGIGSDPWSKEPLYYVEWDNGRTLNLVGDEDVWVKDDKTINEQVELKSSPTINSELGRIMQSIGPIPKSKLASSKVIQKYFRVKVFVKTTMNYVGKTKQKTIPHLI